MKRNYEISAFILGLAVLSSCSGNNRVQIAEPASLPSQELVNTDEQQSSSLEDSLGNNTDNDDTVAVNQDPSTDEDDVKTQEEKTEDKTTESGGVDSGEEDDNIDNEPFGEEKPSVRIASFKTAEPFNDEEAISFIKQNCSSCHAIGGSHASFWGFNPAAISKESLKADSRAKLVYGAIRKAVEDENIDKLPLAMPPGASDSYKDEAARFLVWFESNVISVYNSAKAFYGIDSHESEIKQVFTCSNPITTRQFLRRFANNAFGREPSLEELQEYQNIDTPVTAEIRNEVAAKINNSFTLKNEFLGYAVRRFAQKLSGVDDIFVSDNGPITPAVHKDLKLEFYNLIKAKYETHSFKDMLLDDEVFVTSLTAPLYGAPYAGCAVPPAGDWGVCKMKEPRGSFFTTLSYLNSKPSTFLIPNNNYGRVATMHFIVDGKVLEAATDGPTGDTVNPLPSCLKTKDLRGELSGDSFAPHGTAMIPLTGNICQSCHVSKYLAAGSIAYRPFDLEGQEYKVTDIIPTNPLVANLIDPDHPYVNQNVDSNLENDYSNISTTLLQDLLDIGSNSEQGCIPGGGDSGEDIIVNNVKDLAHYMTKDEKRLARGLARHIPTSISNVGDTTEELVVKMEEAWEEGNGKLGKMFEAYFASETFSCNQEDMAGE